MSKVNNKDNIKTCDRVALSVTHPVQTVTRGDKKRERITSHHEWSLAASSTSEIAGVVFTIVIELRMPHTSAGWQDELAGVVYGEARWQVWGVICGADWKNRTNPYSVKARLMIFIIVRSSALNWIKGLRVCVCVCISMPLNVCLACAKGGSGLTLYQAKVSTESFLHNSVSDNTGAFLSTHITAASIFAFSQITIKYSLSHSSGWAAEYKFPILSCSRGDS